MTDKKTEALKLALEALEANQPANYCMNNNGEKFPMMQEDPFRFERNSKAITALREALAEQPAQQQEPVANELKLHIIRKWPEGFQDRLQHVWLDVVSFIPDVKLYDLQRVLAEFGFTMKVYEGDPPANKPWVGLTDEQIAVLNFMLGVDDLDGVWFGERHPKEKGAFWWRNRLRNAFQDAAIEAKLREKNA